MNSSPKVHILRSAFAYWTELASRDGRLAATRALVATLWEFLRDSTPGRLRQRFGDADYDWDHRVNTTSGAVGWRDRLVGMFHSAYQPTEPSAFHEMMSVLEQRPGFDFRDFTFLDLGSGKGRTLLMASDYPFRRIVGVELLPSLHQIAQDNLRLYRNESQQCRTIESFCADATEFPLPPHPLVLYLFNPFPESGIRKVIANVEQSLRTNPRPIYVLYHNAQLEHLLVECPMLHKLGGTHQYSVFHS